MGGAYVGAQTILHCGCVAGYASTSRSWLPSWLTSLVMSPSSHSKDAAVGWQTKHGSTTLQQPLLGSVPSPAQQ
jgi:hypothetical protein